ncbi:hypothetical protein NLM33_17775 [Bradyrhizobium sp. CCGUVB1N3]|uniref:hypothetical protein n=1 Tax=Bradyrhizobium sp. CCGUVB1N3 TaxID=2949629 RepID=UPI0020B34D92|nr:hypothetical protein [Bradyrhizobium sp. CCGUVB1N3]MCP3472166.1 hypothetical protein [Bradyrhizobium sp. CCGUVB1N3]
MLSSSRTRIVLIILALATGCYGAASLIAEATALDRPEFPWDLSKGSPLVSSGSEWLGLLFVFRSDLAADQVLAAALNAIQKGKSGGSAAADDEPLRTRLKRTVAFAPYDAGLWLSLALLEMQRDPNSPTTVEALRMSYLTAPNDARLMPARLDAATRFDAVADPDLKELALGDVRIMLTRSPAQKTAVVAAYRRASSRGRAFLDEATQSIDPAFLPTLRS